MLFRLGVVTFVVALLLPTAGVGSDSVPDQRLAQRLVVAPADVPRQWRKLYIPAHPLVQCIEGRRRLTDASARERGLVGTPNSGVWSFATVFASENEATRFYASVLDWAPTCIRRMLRRPRPAYIAAAEVLQIGRYGDRSQGWRLRFRSETRRAFDWAVVRTGRAVLVDVFLVAYFDDRWRDRTSGASASGSIALERTVLRKALERATRN